MRKISLLLLISLMLFLACEKNIIDKEKLAKFALVKGTVTMLEPNSNDKKLVKIGSLIPNGSKIITEKDSMADIVTASGKIRILSNSELNVNSVNANQNQFQIHAGDILVKINQLKKSEEFKVTTPTVVAGVRGTQFWGQVKPADQSGTFAVREGKLEIMTIKSGKTLILTTGEAVDLDPAAKDNKVRKAVDGEMSAMKMIDEM